MITELSQLSPDLKESAFINCDCMEGMKKFPDKWFDLAVVDPPYGDAMDNSGGSGTGSVRGSTGTRHCAFGIRKNSPSYENRRHMGAEIRKKIIAWDVAPKQEYFDELFRISRHQIIWGGNYFNLPPTRCFLVWKKLTISENFSMAMAEYAWTSFNENAKVFECAPQDSTGQRFHPTQKPLKLYEWIMQKYAKPNFKILDTHAGSGSSLLAAYRTQHQFVGFEIDSDYYEKALNRLNQEMLQMTIFDFLERDNGKDQ